MAPAVANPLYFGYRELYKTVLEGSKRGISKAMRVFADKDNYPVLLHCIHGEHIDRICSQGKLVIWLGCLFPLMCVMIFSA